MTFTRHQRIALAISALLFSTLACRAVTRLIIPDTPTPLPTLTATLLPTFTPTLPPTATATATLIAVEASCPLVVSQIITDSTSSDAHAPSRETTSNEKVTYLVHYFVQGDELETPFRYPVKDKFKTKQDDRAAQADIWSYFTRLIPAEERTLVSDFSIFTDGRYNLLASVNQSDKNAKTWELNVDIADAGKKTELTYTLLHEFGHLLTLNADQVKVSQPVYNHPDDEDIYNKEVAACPQYFTGEGCSNPDSYINKFYDRFWPDLYAEWQKIDAVKDDDARQNKLDEFYRTYKDQFVTDYAPTSPAEDIAESWTFFIFSPKPEATSIANEKILFFYDYPELVALRTTILEHVCTEFPQ